MFLVIDSNRQDLSIEELKCLLYDTSATQNKTLEDFCVKLREFIVNFERIPHLPNDQKYFDRFDMDDLIYLIENCRKFKEIESLEPEEEISTTNSSKSIFDEFKVSAILAAEIQKIITRKYLPITELFKI